MSFAQDGYTDDSDDNLEESLHDFREQNQKLVEQIQKTHGGAAGGSKGNLNIKPEMDVKKLRPIVKQLNSVYSRMSYESSRAQIQENISKSPAKGMAKAFPKTVDFITHLLRDNQALLSLLDMFKDKQKLLYFLLANIFTIILGFVLARRASKEGSLFSRLFKWMFRKCFIYGLRIFILIFFFGSELAPTFNIVKEVFL
ncbi:putative membrane protein [Halobacteriovorax marinus SJ]|uniref:Membrane protein n=1 Tax=Halobacteriovorax marinus (strain ATCC BAA-682 / DSM 15412 / SJ) TaxID=862908 RepID=E1X0T8_HALMS|nr:hypothetical protein [Halobacteriovorax marinus]CBW26426.1 putative membrane protein [Halobacteriovorax marinus SJ]